MRQLHIDVATISGGIARYADEVTEQYIQDIFADCSRGGLIFVAEDAADKRIVGELHTYPYGLRRLAHVLTALTIAVHPTTQRQGVGRRLFEALIDEVRANRPEILRIELIVQESNPHARRLYESVGFRAEGRLLNAILSTSTGLPENDIPMAWHRNPPT